MQYDFQKPTTIEGVEVYWFDDTGIGRCRVPSSWRVLYKEGNDWKSVKRATTYGVKKDAFNSVEFKSVATTALRLEVQLQKEFSGGILEWRLRE